MVRRRPLRRMQRERRPHAARSDSPHARRLSRSRRRHCRDRELPGQSNRARRVRPRARHARAQPYRRDSREQAAKFSTPDKRRFVAGSMGPTTKSISVTGGITFDQMRDGYQIQAEGLHRRRRRHPAARDRQRHAQLQGRPGRNRERDRQARRRPRGLRVGNDRDDGHAAQRSGHRGVLYFARASRPCSGWASTARPVPTS